MLRPNPFRGIVEIGVRRRKNTYDQEVECHSGKNKNEVMNY